MLEPDLSVHPALSTERLALRPFHAGDVEALHRLRSDERTMAFVGRPRSATLADAAALIHRMELDRRQGDGIGWAMQLRDDPALIGTIGFYRLKKEHHRAEIGYLLDPGQWGKGLMHEAMGAVLECGFDRYHFHSIEAVTDPRNTASRRVLERRGFVLEGLFKENYFAHGEFLDSAVYSLLCSAYKPR
jgi:ribosomal-protein-alanine N-acetyltransferase